MATFLYNESVNGGSIEFGKTIDAYANNLSELANRLQKINPVLIDYFLGENEDLRDVGTLVIAHVILERTLDWKKNANNENRESQTKSQTKPQTKRDHRKEDDWYKFIVDRLTRECKNFDELKEKNENQVKFITFNYDMSLELELYERLSSIHLYANAKDKMRAFVKSLIVHVYGYCDSLEFNGREEKEKLQKAFEMSGSIKVIMPEKIDTRRADGEMVDARETLKEAKIVYILGYGFDDNNNALLDLKENLGFNGMGHSVTRKSVYFTNFEDRNLINKKAGMILCNYPSAFLNENIYQKTGQRLFTCEKSTKNTFNALADDFD